jgi:polyisoprenyl-phosphate glycosyltransferase
MTEVSVVVPVYKGERSLKELYRRLCESLLTITPDFELVLVEDHGGDGSWALIEELAKQDGRVRGLRLARNFGQHPAITAGVDQARGNWLVVMDCDLQDRPEEIPLLYRKAQQGFDVVVARRAQRQDSWLKRKTSRLFYRAFSWLAGIRLDADVGNFRIVSRQVADGFRSMRETTRFFGGMIAWMGFPTAAIDVQHDSRSEGTSTYTYRSLLNLALNIIVAYSDRPLWMSVRIGFTVSGFAVFGGIWVVYRAFRYGIPIMGWASLIVSLYFLGGVIISLLGVIGIYLAKVFDGVKARPLYIVAQRTDDLSTN